MKQMKNRKVMLGIIVLTAICGCRSVGIHESILKEQISGLDKFRKCNGNYKRGWIRYTKHVFAAYRL